MRDVCKRNPQFRPTFSATRRKPDDSSQLQPSQLILRVPRVAFSQPRVAFAHATRRIFTCHTSQKRPPHVASQFSNESNVKMACNCRQNLHDSALPTLEPTPPKRTVAQSDKCSECRFVGFFREKITGYKPPFAAKMRKGQKKTNAPKLSSERSLIIILLCCAVYSSAGVSSATGSATGASSTAGVSATGAATGAPSATTVKGTCAATSLCSFTVAT